MHNKSLKKLLPSITPNILGKRSTFSPLSSDAYFQNIWRSKGKKTTIVIKKSFASLIMKMSLNIAL